MNQAYGFRMPKYKPGDILVHKSDDLDIIEVLDNSRIGMTKFEEYWKDKETLMYRLRVILFDREMGILPGGQYCSDYSDVEKWYQPATKEEHERVRARLGSTA